MVSLFERVHLDSGQGKSRRGHGHLKQHHASDSVLKAQATSKKGPTMNYELTVTGMTCGHCEKAVTRALLQVDPDAKVAIDRSQNRVTVSSDKEKPALVQAIVEEGYTVAD